MQPSSSRRPLRTWIAGVALLSAGLLPVLVPASASAAPGVDEISIVDGETASVFDYTEAVRERVFIPVPGVDQDLDGVDDVTTVEIIRPLESDGALRVPAIIDASPYYTTVGRGNESELIADVDGDGLNDKWPLFYDNYFVERGYAVVLAQMDGTGSSTGCPMQGGAGDIASMKVVVDWLQGRAPGHYAGGEAATATWHNGKAGMIGKSYDGTLANGVAATGVVGLTTIVPIAGISDWYGYSRTNGIRHNTDYPASLSNTVTNPDRRALCAPTRTAMSAVDGDETGDVNAFWAERDYTTDIDKVTASVFAVHGLNDDNVRMSQLGDYWDALSERDVPRKIWLSRLGHVDPFEYNRAEWVSTLHHWFDYWLQGVPNGIMDEPMASVESMQPGVFDHYAAWPVPGTEDVAVNLAATTDGAPGALQLGAATGLDQLSFTGPANTPSEASIITAPDGSQSSRLSFVSQPLATELRISGTATVELTAALSTTQSNLAALLVDYGSATVIPRSPGDGVANTTVTSCWGSASADDDGCYLEAARRSASVDQWRVTRGVLDSSNRESLIDGEAVPVVAGEDNVFAWPLEPYDHVFPAGHRIGVVVTTNMSGFIGGTPGATVALDTTASRIVLPVVGGQRAAVASAALGAADPSTVAFDLGGHGEQVPAQEVAFDTPATAPTDPAETGWVFQGWFADAERTVPFDFATPVTGDTTVFALWSTLADAVRTLEIEPIEQTVNQGDTVTLQVSGFDAAGLPLGDVGDLATVSSSVASDIVAGTRVTFPHASPHVLTATVGAASASILVEVVPTAVVPVPSVPAGTDGGADDTGLAVTGAQLLVPGIATVVLLALGAVAVLFGRRRRGGTAAGSLGG